MFELIRGDCLEEMKKIESGSVDMVLTDPPYGITACKWDSVIPFELMWKELNRVCKKNAAQVFTASQPFTSFLVCSNSKMFRHSWVYRKRCASNFAQAKYAPMKEHEDVIVFGINRCNYYPIKEQRRGSGKQRAKYPYTEKSRNAYGEFIRGMNGGPNTIYSGNDPLRYPASVQEFNNRASGDRGLHPTQKPVALMEYLIKTYTNEGDTVLDFTMGSGTTCVAAINLNRNFIGIELDEEYFKIAQERIEEAYLQ